MIRLTRDETFKVVFNLRTPVMGGESVGTGMFICDDDNTGYLLTATHVAIGSNHTTKIVVSDASSNCQLFDLINLNPLLNWKHHPVADISILKITTQTINHLRGHFFPISQLNLTENTPSRDDYLTSVGFPNGMGIGQKFSPFTFRSHASSALITLNRFDIHTPCNFFTLENPSVGGYSGGPIFDLGYIIVGSMTTYTGQTTCHGIMHGTISDNTGGKIAAVTPCYYIKDLI